MRRFGYEVIGDNLFWGEMLSDGSKLQDIWFMNEMKDLPDVARQTCIDRANLVASIMNIRGALTGPTASPDQVPRMVTPKMRERIGFAIGAASMCWSEIPTGVFDTERALQVQAELITAIEQHLKGEG